MTVAELFINLGVKGADQAVKSVSAVDTGIKQVASSSLAAKAAIVGAIYALERLTAAAGAHGVDLQKFANLTGLSTDSLQRWQYMAKMSGESADSMKNSIVAVQGAMTKMAMGQGAPGGLAEVARVVGGLDQSKLQDTFYMLTKLREYAQKEKNVPWANQMLATFGVGPETIATLRSSKMELEKISNANILSSKQIEQLAKVNQAWEKFWHTLQMVRDQLVATYGTMAINNFQNAFKFLTDVAKNLQVITKEIPILQKVMVAAGVAIAATWAPVLSSILAIVYALSELQKWREGKDNIYSKTYQAGANLLGNLFGPSDEEKSKMTKPQRAEQEGFLANFFRSILPKPEDVVPGFGGGAQNVIPFAPRVPPTRTPNTNNTTVNQVNHFNGVEGAADAAEMWQKELRDTIGQNPARTRVN